MFLEKLILVAYNVVVIIILKNNDLLSNFVMEHAAFILLTVWINLAITLAIRHADNKYNIVYRNFGVKTIYLINLVVIFASFPIIIYGTLSLI